LSSTAVDFTCRTPEEVEAEGDAAYEKLKDSLGRFRTQSLFIEHKNDKYAAPFTLKDRAHRGRVSMYEKYMEIGDPTEYTQAIAMLGSWRHWQLLVNADWFKPYVERWRSELQVKMESDRFREMDKVAETLSGTSKGIAATKWLADRYGSKPKPKRGRPTKDEIVNNLKEDTKEAKLLEEEAERLGIVA
jgi:hypothetical protein